MPRGRLASLILVAAFCAAPRAAVAQDSDKKAAAQALFEEGRRLMDEGKLAEACKKLLGSQKLDPGAGTLLNLAACYEKNGQTASAWVTYKDAATASADRRPDWAQRAREKAAALEPNLSRLTISVVASAPGLQVTRDGIEVAREVFGASLPVDPGEHTIVARAPGRTAFEAKVTVGVSKDVQTVTVPELAVAEQGATAPGVPAARGGPTAAVDSADSAGAGGAQRAVGLVVGGLGVVGIGLGSVFGLIALGKKGDAEDPANCTSDLSRCNAEGKALVDDAGSAATVSTIGFVAGGALLAGGVVLYLTAPSSSSKRDSATRVARVHAGLGSLGAPLGLTVAGAFR